MKTFRSLILPLVFALLLPWHVRAALPPELHNDVKLTGLLNEIKSGAVFTNNGTFTNSGTMGGAGTFDFHLGTLTLADAQIAWVKVNKTGSSLADLTTRSASDLSSGTTALARGGTGAGTAAGALDNLITAEATVASATTTDLGAVTSHNVSVTGTTTITSFGTATAGITRWGRFTGALTLTHNATSLILPSAANITTAANDRFCAYSLGSGNWLVYSYTRADGSALTGAGVGTVTHTGGAMTSNGVALGGGSGDIKVAPGITTDGTSQLTLGEAGTSAGALNFKNTTSGTTSIAPPAGALGTVLNYTPAANGTLLNDASSLNASNLGSGTVPDARFPATLPAASGVNLTALNASNLGSGTVPDARFPATLPAASGVNLTALNASNLSSGTAPIARGGTNASTAAGALDSLITAEATVASATTTDLGAVTSRNVSITGTTTITGLGTVTSGVMRYGRFTGALTLTHNATSLILPSAANITTAANDRFTAISLGSGNWLVYSYTRADGTALVGGVSGPYTSLAATMSTARLLGRTTASTGQAEEISVSGATLSGGVLTIGAGSGTKTLMRWTALDNQPPSSTYATFNQRNAIAVLEFDASTAPSAVLVGRIPEGADFTTGIAVYIEWMAATATSSTATWTSAFERGNTDQDSDSFATGVDSSADTTSGTSGITTTTIINHSGSEIDGLTAGDSFRLKITRKTGGLTGNAQVKTVEIRQR